MEVEIRVEAEFWTQAKRLSKKYHSMKKDLQEFKKSLIGDPYQGSSLGRGVRKVRMAIAPTTLSRICSMSEKIYKLFISSV